MGRLFIISTPIGNLKDVSLRAIKTLEDAHYIASEDTRKTGLLLKNLGIEKKGFLISYYEQNEHRRIPEIIDILKSGRDIALVSDAGTPTISDPGFKLVRECAKEDIKVIPIPGPSSVMAALVASALPTDKFLFFGYFPKKDGDRKKVIKQVKSLSKIIEPTIIFFEVPHRIIKALEALKEGFGDIKISVCRELTKIHEEIRRENISESLEHFQKNKPKGEIVILLNLKKKL